VPTHVRRHAHARSHSGAMVAALGSSSIPEQSLLC
jgi:hypothetical protein